MMCMGGMMVVTLLKGPLLHMWPTNLLRYSHTQAPAHYDMVVGTFLLCGSCLIYAQYFVVQIHTANPVLLIGSWNYIFVTILAQRSALNSHRLRIESGNGCEGIPIKVLDALKGPKCQDWS
jgi:hypothetical protein